MAAIFIIISRKLVGRKNIGSKVVEGCQHFRSHLYSLQSHIEIKENESGGQRKPRFQKNKSKAKIIESINHSRNYKIKIVRY